MPPATRRAGSPCKTSCRAPTHLRLPRGKRPVATQEIEVRVAPGQQVADLVLRPPPPVTARVVSDAIPTGPQRRPGGGAEEVVIIEGTVRDEQGRGVAGASVYAASSSTAA